MKRNFLLLVMMCLLGGFSSSLMAQETTVQVGTIGTSESNIYPYISTYNYSTSQQIYKASEIGKGGTISKIAFHVSDEGVNKKVYDVKIYIKHTTKDAFASKTDWDKTVTSEHLVYDGNPDITNSLLEIPLTTPFEYDGTQNLLVCFDVNSKQGAATYYRTYSADSKRVMYYRNANNYGPDAANYYNNAASSSPTNMIPVITLTFGGSVQAKDPEFTDTYAYPSNNATGIFNPYLKFYAENKTHYKVLLSTSEDFSANVTYVAGSATTWVESPASVKEVSTANISGLTYNPATKYYWKVIASNGGGQSDPTAEKVYSFTTKEVTTNPGAVTNMLPEDGATGLLNPELTWTYGDNTVDYQVIVDDEVKVDWTNIGYDETGSYQTSDLSSGEHTWRVNTRNNNETYTEGSLYTFTVASLPDNVTPVSPTDGATGVASNVVRFQFAPNTEEYRLLYSDSNAGEMGYISVNNGGTGNTWTSTGGATEMEFTIPGFGLGKTLYWAVDVKNSIGQRSVWNGGEEIAIYSFTVASTLPVANVAPENGANNLDNPELSWNFKGNATHYMVYLGTEENNLTAQTEWLARGTEGTGLAGSGSYQTADLTPATKYFWRVDVKEGETVLAGDVWSFVTTLPTPEAQANPAQVVPSFGIVFGGTTINWGKIETAQGYNVYLDGVKLNDELIPTNTNYYAIPANSMKLQYNMTGYTFNVQAVYEGMGSVMSGDVIVKVTGTGYLSATIFKNDYKNRLEGATITLSCTEDEFGNTYEEGNGRQYVLTTDSNGQYLSSTEGNERIQNGTYDVTVEKAYFDTYTSTITIKNNQTSTISEILTADNTVIFDVTLFNESFNTIEVYLENANWEDAQAGYYNVYLKNGEDIEDLGTHWFQAPNNMTTSVYITYTDWAYLGKGNYQFGVSKIDDQINWSGVKARNYDVFEGRTDSWSLEGNWRDGELPSENANVYVLSPLTINEDEDITTGTVTIQGDGIITINGSLTADNVYNNTQAGNLCINDGGQLRQNNTNLNGKFVMNIVKGDWTVENDTTGWQFISSPINNAPITQFIPANQAQGDYDLYRYDGGMWYNHKAEENNQFNDETFVYGRAYLASYEDAETATLSGKLNAEKTFARQYSYTEEVENEDKLKNFFLVGNPFTFDMDLKYMTCNNVVEGIAVVKPTGGYEYRTVSNNGIVPVGDGFFIKTTGAYPSISYNETAAAKRSEKVESINIIASSNAGEDNVIINFNGKKEGFNKLQNFNEGIANIFVAKENERYGIFNCNRDVNEVTLSFIPKQMGSYSISFDIDGEFESVVLVDRLTGIETDMLAEKEYNFIATKDDRSDRFVLKLANGEEPSENSQFVYQSGEELIINAEGTIQIIDMMGRMVYSSNAENSRINVSNLKGATYIVRNITDNDVKVQKVVIY